MILESTQELPQRFLLKPWFIIRQVLLTSIGLAILAPCGYSIMACFVSADPFLRVDPLILPFFKYWLAGSPLAFTVALTGVLCSRYKNLVVTVDESGIEIKTARNCTRITWERVASFYNFGEIYFFGEDGNRLLATPVLIIPQYVDVNAIARVLEEIGVPRQKRSRFVNYWNYRAPVGK